MEFNSYMDWKNQAEKIGFDVILGVKDTIEADTLYITIADSKKVGSDNFSWVISYTYNVTASVQDADSNKIKQLSEIIAGGIEFVDYSDASHLYSYSGQVTLPVSASGGAFDE